ncbi:hypothetical protein [Streptomyces prunicolor]
MTGYVDDGRGWTPGELHLLAVQLTEALTDVHRVAECRGARRADPVWDNADAIDDEDDNDDAPERPAEAAG